MQDLWKKFLWVIEVAGFGICQFCEYTAQREGLTATYCAGAAILQLPYLQTVLFMAHLAKFTGCYSTSIHGCFRSQGTAGEGPRRLVITRRKLIDRIEINQ